MEIGEFVCVIVTSEMTFDSGEVCCYMGSENKTKRLKTAEQKIYNWIIIKKLQDLLSYLITRSIGQ